MEGIPLIDTHCHLDFAGNAAELAAAYVACGGALSGTCDPRDFERVRTMFAPYAPRVRVGLGLHPWWVADGTCGEEEVALFERLVPAAPLISEVGFDFQPRRADTRDAQIEAFERVCVAAARPSAEFPRRIMSIHSSAAAMCTLDVLERTGCLDVCLCIFHWFSGSQEELTRAIDAGCLFSVNERMLKTKRGRAYARAIPKDRLLIETDFPGKPGTTALVVDVAPRLARTMSLLAEARGDDERLLASAIAAASKRLLLS
ncbi:TatD family hydrolase [Ellagibacter isourolithinifaciens]|uniref:TatD family hydrolase n=1 Tax=Ellagibacter isourolithinifaciens TaxID=2137581 RepID=UPI002E792F28|nr:TatD family hydrolase [Ellagibacter isourolithinifaciens]MEE0245867.1 TatD family hydrolase [Ellagibacter isourolithinifaciens]